MKKKVITAMVITGALALGACQEDTVMDELTDDKELNQLSEPEQEEDAEYDPM